MFPDPKACIAGALLAIAANAAAADYPRVSVDYFARFDQACADLAKKPADEAAITEIGARLEEFRAHWAKDEAALMGSVVGVTGVPFRFGETRAALVSCGLGSISLPLLVNVRPYLAAVRGEKVMPLSDFSNTVFHETLHRYVGDSIRALPGGKTPLLQKYAAEPPVVRNHLHLFAIEELVYRKLGREKELAVSVAFESTLNSSGAYQRARAIVAMEGAEALVKELAPEKGTVVAPYVPTPSPIADRLFALANIKPDDYLIDLGSGDGRLVIDAVAKYKARGAAGIEIDADLVKGSIESAKKAGVADRVTFIAGDLFAADVSKATVVTLYLLPRIMGQVAEKLGKELKPGTRVISHDYALPTWKPVEVVEFDAAEKVAITGSPRTVLYLYRVPERP